MRRAYRRPEHRPRYAGRAESEGVWSAERAKLHNDWKCVDFAPTIIAVANRDRESCLRLMGTSDCAVPIPIRDLGIPDGFYPLDDAFALRLGTGHSCWVRRDGDGHRAIWHDFASQFHGLAKDAWLPRWMFDVDHVMSRATARRVFAPEHACFLRVTLAPSSVNRCFGAIYERQVTLDSEPQGTGRKLEVIRWPMVSKAFGIVALSTRRVSDADILAIAAEMRGLELLSDLDIDRPYGMFRSVYKYGADEARRWEPLPLILDGGIHLTLRSSLREWLSQAGTVPGFAIGRKPESPRRRRRPNRRRVVEVVRHPAAF